ncbi:MAG: hypothetical protein Q8P24_16710 [Desulfobacterales bacterium]|nr:hypothetical protein [Desulfobacterales bacterium]
MFMLILSQYPLIDFSIKKSNPDGRKKPLRVDGPAVAGAVTQGRGGGGRQIVARGLINT